MESNDHSDGVVAQGLPFDPLSPEFRENPFESYAGLLETNAQLFQIGPNTWFLPRHADVKRLLREDKRMTKDKDRLHAGLQPGSFHVYQHNIMAFLDRPRHTTVRKVVAYAFTPRAIERLEAVTQAAAKALVEDMIDEPEFDLVDAFALKLPVTIICRMLGVSTEHEALFKRSSTGITTASEGFATPEMLAEADEVCRLMNEMLDDEIARRGEAPDGEDLISVMIRHAGEGGLTGAELRENITFMLAAGHETTTATIAAGVKFLCESPDAHAALRGDPSLIPNAIEEFLRLEPPLHFMHRFAAADAEVAGQTIHGGDDLLFGLATAARDPLVFDRPHELDIRRSNARDHMAFSQGIHTCLGAALARMEARVAFEVLVDRFQSFEASGPPKRRLGFVFQGYTDLPVRATAA